MIINHRMGRYAASLDIKKAYRQIKVSYKDSMVQGSIEKRRNGNL